MTLGWQICTGEMSLLLTYMRKARCNEKGPLAPYVPYGYRYRHPAKKGTCDRWPCLMSWMDGGWHFHPTAQVGRCSFFLDVQVRVTKGIDFNKRQ